MEYQATPSRGQPTESAVITCFAFKKHHLESHNINLCEKSSTDPERLQCFKRYCCQNSLKRGLFQLCLPLSLCFLQQPKLHLLPLCFYKPSLYKCMFLFSIQLLMHFVSFLRSKLLGVYLSLSLYT